MLGTLWMPDLVNLNFLCGENFSISIFLKFAMLLGNSWILPSLAFTFYSLLGGSGTVLILGLITPYF